MTDARHPCPKRRVQLGFALRPVFSPSMSYEGNTDTAAGTAETVIGLVLLAGLITTIVREPLTRNAGLVAQLFALLGTLVGVFTIIVGVGPRTVIDVVIHTVMLALLGSGLVFTRGTMTVH